MNLRYDEQSGETASSVHPAPPLTKEGSLVNAPKDAPNGHRLRSVGLCIFGAIVAAIFGKPLFALAAHAAGTDLHSHILLVPFISTYLLYIRRQELPSTWGSSLGAAAFSLLAGLGALISAWTLRSGSSPISHNDYLALVVLSFICFLLAGGFAFLGTKWMAAAAFPVFFLVFMIPLPDGVVERLETASKLASAEATDLFFNLSGTPFLRDGLIFQLPGITLEVAQECSGIRSSWVLLMTSLLAAHLFLRTPWRRAFLVAVVIPLGIARNAFRILVIGLLCVHIGPHMINSLIHKRGGPLFFALSLIPLCLVLWLLRRSEKSRYGRPVTETNSAAAETN